MVEEVTQDAFPDEQKRDHSPQSDNEIKTVTLSKGKKEPNQCAACVYLPNSIFPLYLVGGGDLMRS